MPHPFSAWILAGGQSRRMGSDKALLRLDETNQPLVLQIANRFMTTAQSVQVIADPIKYAALGIPVVGDRRSGCGPLAGIETALLTSTSDWNAIVACDLAAVDPTIFSAMLETPDLELTEAIVPRHETGKLEPLCALYNKRAGSKVSHALDAGTRRVLTVLDRLTLRYFPVQDTALFDNLNTPEDLDRYRNG